MDGQNEDHVPSAENTYPTSSLLELNRLQEQDTFQNQRTQLRPATADRPGLALLPPEFQPEPGATVLDVGCGSGGWCLEIAHSCPELRVIGLDNDIQKVDYAKSQAVALGVQNAEFLLGDMFKLTEKIPLNSVNVLHARYLEWFVKDYAALLQQWITVLKSGGMFCLTESEGPTTTSAAYNRINNLFFEVLEKTHGKTRVDGVVQGKTMHMYHLLLGLGMRQIREIAHVINFGINTPDREFVVRSNSYGLISMKPFMVHSGLISSEEYDRVAEEATRDLWSDTFLGNQFILTVTGIKP